jgi:U3 small nucleolar RNA-associated protein 14
MGIQVSFSSNSRFTKNSANDSEEEEYDDSEESILGESDPEHDDGQLESLSAFVDSLSSKKDKAHPEPQFVAEKPIVEGANRLKHTLTSLVSNELSMNDILSSLTDPSLQSFRKSLASQQTSKSKSVGQKLSAPLARPLQERLERQAAYEETKTEITKWQPLVKANREVIDFSIALTSGRSFTIPDE